MCTLQHKNHRHVIFFHSKLHLLQAYSENTVIMVTRRSSEKKGQRIQQKKNSMWSIYLYPLKKNKERHLLPADKIDQASGAIIEACCEMKPMWDQHSVSHAHKVLCIKLIKKRNPQVWIDNKTLWKLGRGGNFTRVSAKLWEIILKRNNLRKTCSSLSLKQTLRLITRIST